MTDVSANTAGAPDRHESGPAATRQARRLRPIALVRGWCRRLVASFWSASPDRQISQLYYLLGILAFLTTSSVWLWHKWTNTSAAAPTFTVFSQALAKENSPADARRALDRLRELGTQLRALKPNSTKEIDRALHDLEKGDLTAIEGLLRVWKEEAATLNKLRVEAQSQRYLAVVVFIYNKGNALGELEKAVKIDPGYWDAWYDLGDVAVASGATERAQEAFKVALDLARSDTHQPLRQIKSLIRFGDVLRTRGMTAAGFITLDEAWTLIAKALELEKNNEDFLIAKENVLVRRGDYYQAWRREDEALKAFQEGLAVAAQLAEAKPTDLSRQSDLAAAHIRVGNLWRKRGDLQAAQTAFEKADMLARHLANAASKDLLNAPLQRNLAASYTHLGKLKRERGDRIGALNAFESARSVLIELGELDRQNVQWQRDLAVNHRHVGDMQRELRRWNEALKSYDRGKAVIRDLATRDPLNLQLQKDLADFFIRTGDLHADAKKLKDALEAYEAAWKIIGARVEINGNPEWRSQLANIEGRLGDVLRAEGDRAGAQGRYERSLDIARALTRRTPDSARYKRDLVIALNRVGDLLFDSNDRDAAISYYRESAQSARELIVLSKTSVRWQLDLIVSLRRLAELGVERRENLVAIVSVFEQMEKKGILSADQKTALVLAREEVARLN